MRRVFFHLCASNFKLVFPLKWKIKEIESIKSRIESLDGIPIDWLLYQKFHIKNKHLCKTVRKVSKKLQPISKLLFWFRFGKWKLFNRKFALIYISRECIKTEECTDFTFDANSNAINIMLAQCEPNKLFNRTGWNSCASSREWEKKSECKWNHWILSNCKCFEWNQFSVEWHQRCSAIKQVIRQMKNLFFSWS